MMKLLKIGRIYISFVFLLLVYFLCKCNSEELIEYEYYDTGEIKRIKEYRTLQDLKEKLNYTSVGFYKNGDTSEIASFVNGKLEGNYLQYSNNKDDYVKSITKMKNGKKYGTDISYNKDGGIITEVLYLNNEKVIWKNLTVYSESQEKGYKIFNSNGEEEGAYIIDENYQPIYDENNYYYFVEAEDTIHKQYEYNVLIKLLISGVDTTHAELYLNNDTIIFRDKICQFTIDSFQQGYNLLLGKIDVIKDTLIDNVEYNKEFNFTFYHEFYVKE